MDLYLGFASRVVLAAGQPLPEQLVFLLKGQVSREPHTYPAHSLPLANPIGRSPPSLMRAVGKRLHVWQIGQLATLIHSHLSLASLHLQGGAKGRLHLQGAYLEAHGTSNHHKFVYNPFLSGEPN